MTSPRQRLGRPSPSRINNEAALVGALTAFAKSPSNTTGPPSRNVVHVKPAGGSLTRTLTAPLKPPVESKRPVLNGRTPSESLHRPVRHDSAAVLNVVQDAQRQAPKSVSTTIINATEVNIARPPKRPKPLQLDGKAPLAEPLSSPAFHEVKDGVTKSSTSDQTRTSSMASLVQLYEKKGTAEGSVRPDTPLKSPKPVRKSLVLRQDDRTISSQLAQVDTGLDDEITADERPNTSKSAKSGMSSGDSFRSARDSFSPLNDRKPSLADKPNLPPPRRSTQPLRRPEKPPQPKTSPDNLSVLPLHSAPIPIRSSTVSSPYNHATAASSTASIQATYNALHPRRTSTLKTGDALANALVASSLASSRGPSPAKLSPQPPLPSSLHSTRSHHSLFSRTPSPHKRKPASAGGMRHTLRKERESSADDDALEEDPFAKHRRKRHIHKHANKYHEGDRKRWRGVVTETERGRYEGVWAANKGLLGEGDSVDRGEEVHGYVVKDLWGRSRLPAHVLGEVWELVDGGKDGWLSKEEFVVGLWLVDQRLKGRKLPMRVSDSVWDSVRLLKGIRVKAAKGRVR